jgi:type IV pilus assembly protein PilQ
LEQVLQLLQKLDVAVRQVMIEVRIVTADEAFGKSLGVKFGATDQRANKGGDGGYALSNSGNNRIAFGTSYQDAVASSGGGGTVNTTGSFITLPAATPSGANLGTTGAVPSFALSIFSNLANRFLNLEISALEADSKGKIVSSPRVVTSDGKKAFIKQGQQVPYQSCTGTGGTQTCTTAFKDAALRLEVTPQITPEGSIIMDLDVNKDAINTAYTSNAGPVLEVKNVTTQVLVENGGTVLIGGVFELEESSNQTGVPVLADVPWLGNLFKSKLRNSSKRELLVFVTPRIISDKNGTR